MVLYKTSVVLTRQGNKARISQEIIKHFPKHEIYIEPFFGAGGIFFNKPQSRYSVLNDLDNDIYNLNEILMNDDKYNEFLCRLKNIIFTEQLFKDYVNNRECKDDIEKAIKFLFLSNYSYLADYKTLRLAVNSNFKQNILGSLDKIRSYFTNSNTVNIYNRDYRKLLKNLAWISKIDKDKAFIYLDPPYQDSKSYQNNFTKDDFIEMLDIINNYGCKFAISEFDNDFVINEANKRDLNIINIAERWNLKNRKNEILITNYAKQLQTLF